MIETGKGAHRSVKDYMLTRYACCLIAQNGDLKKEEIAFAQSYFAVQTRKQELIEERISLIERTEAGGTGRKIARLSRWEMAYSAVRYMQAYFMILQMAKRHDRNHAAF